MVFFLCVAVFFCHEKEFTYLIGIGIDDGPFVRLIRIRMIDYIAYLCSKELPQPCGQIYTQNFGEMPWIRGLAYTCTNTNHLDFCIEFSMLVDSHVHKIADKTKPITFQLTKDRTSLNLPFLFQCLRSQVFWLRYYLLSLKLTMVFSIGWFLVIRQKHCTQSNFNNQRFSSGQ